MSANDDCQHKRRYFGSNQTVYRAWTQNGKEILWKSMGSINSLVTHILQNILFCVQQKKEIKYVMEQLEGK